MILEIVSDVPIKLYADGTNVFIYGQTVSSVLPDAETNMDSLMHWFCVNRFCLSIEKSSLTVWCKRLR